MTQLGDLAFYLSAAGGARDPIKGAVYLLYVDPKTSSLVSKLWTGEDKFERVENIAESARPNSTASYIIGSSIRLIAYISPANKLRVCELDDESDEWVDDTSVQHEVHPISQVAAVLLPEDRVRMIFQDPSGGFTLLDGVCGSWSSTTLPVAPKAGSPIGTWMAGNHRDLHIFYVSAKDNCLHYVVEGGGGQWKDVAVGSCVFGEKSNAKRFMVLGSPKDDDMFQVYVMTEMNTVWTFSQGSEKLEKLGKMEGSKFVPDTSEEWSVTISGAGQYWGGYYGWLPSPASGLPYGATININPWY